MNLGAWGSSFVLFPCLPVVQSAIFRSYSTSFSSLQRLSVFRACLSVSLSVCLWSDSNERRPFFIYDSLMFRAFEYEIAPSQYMRNRMPQLCRKLIFLITSHFWWRVFETYRIYRREVNLFGTAYRSNKETCKDNILALLYGFTESGLYGRNHRVPTSVAAQSKGCTVLHRSNATSAYVCVCIAIQGTLLSDY
jgi:hypothetical protein